MSLLCMCCIANGGATAPHAPPLDLPMALTNLKASFLYAVGILWLNLVSSLRLFLQFSKAKLSKLATYDRWSYLIQPAELGDFCDRELFVGASMVAK